MSESKQAGERAYSPCELSSAGRNRVRYRGIVVSEEAARSLYLVPAAPHTRRVKSPATCAQLEAGPSPPRRRKPAMPDLQPPAGPRDRETAEAGP